MTLLNIGFGNMVSSERIVSIVSPEAAPVKRLVQDARDAGMVIDASCGKKTLSVILTDSDHVILSKLRPQKLREAINSNDEREIEE